MNPIDKETRFKRLYFRSVHRGCKETDFLFSLFVDKHLAHLEPDMLNVYEQFLEENDWDIYAWVNDKKTIPNQYQTFIELMRKT